MLKKNIMIWIDVAECGHRPFRSDRDVVFKKQNSAGNPYGRPYGPENRGVPPQWISLICSLRRPGSPDSMVLQIFLKHDLSGMFLTG
jgi:hypothetical protein